jgi:FtsP/CotA-like multicopper oxidase with cupredoxin domain
MDVTGSRPRRREPLNDGMTMSFRTGVAVLVALGMLGIVPSASSAATREYWVAATPKFWNIVPNGRDAIHGSVFPTDETTMQAVVYQRFTRNWRRPMRDDPDVVGDADGIPGPLIRARVGDRVLVHFKNLDTRSARPHSMHFHGFEYDVSSDGAWLPGFSGRGAVVKPGQSFTYRLHARPDSVGVWPYHDHSRAMEESIGGGMYGAVSIRGRRERRPDREFVVVFSPASRFQAINGRAFVGNTPIMRARVGDLVQWDVLAMGSEHHTFHVHGHRWRNPDGTPEDTRTVGPAESFRVRWRERSRGTWFYHCHVENHMAQGMVGMYRVSR